MPASLPRVVIVEDDATMWLYVETALAHLPIDLVWCRSAGEAWQVLGKGPAPALVITDLMLGAESGLGLIERLRAEPGGLRSTRVAVTSAAIDATGVVARLRSLGVWRLMPKPVALDALEACVLDALTDLVASGRKAATPEPGGKVTVDVRISAAIEGLFGGDRSLYVRYRRACLSQFPEDVAQGDAGLEAGDSASLRRVAHNLRSVLRTLGEAETAEQADRLEKALLAGEWDTARTLWQVLRSALLRLIDQV